MIGVLVITAVNFIGTVQGKQTQLVLALLTVAAVLVVVVAGFLAPDVAAAAGAAARPSPGAPPASRWCSSS